jgi:hypothetical protein
MPTSIPTWPIVLLVAVFGILALALLLRGIRVGWRLHRSDWRLHKSACPQCAYPLRFNGREYWCSECGYRHPVKIDDAR